MAKKIKLLLGVLLVGGVKLSSEEPLLTFSRALEWES